MSKAIEVLVRNRGRVRRGLLVRETGKRMLVKLAYLAGRKSPRIVETWVAKSDLATVEGDLWTGVGCVAEPLPAGQDSAEVQAIKASER